LNARSSTLVIAFACALAGACSALDDFTAFTFVADGGVSDLRGGGDLAGASVGAPCLPGSCSGDLTCFTTVGNTSFPGGTCSRACGTGGASCPTGSSCAQVDGSPICLQACNPGVGLGCRADWSCCDGQHTVSGPGLCGPSNSNFCGG
jgi:hypothetical protein